MRFPAPLVAGRLRARYKRFFADVEIGRGEARRIVTAHCANPGSMRTCAEIGGRVWLLPVDDPKRKLAWTWELAEVGGRGGALVAVNTARANQLVSEALGARVIAEVAAELDAGEVRREVAIGDSRIDFLITSADSSARTWIEVKCATMDGGPATAAFPDSVTTRGARHLAELTARRRAGDRAILLFCVARSGCTRLRPADEIDPVYGAALRDAAARGVEVLGYRADIDSRGLALVAPVAIDLG
ncbi:MAG: DNA/RNA nuclease SfsA [Deltaproteobacteria bacterium]|nr:DNA/RNA nuclease SfsA [Deltaproteobacteria bacterium]